MKMFKSEIRSQMLNELCNAAQLHIGRETLVFEMGKIVDKYLSRIKTDEDDLTQDAYHNPMVKLMRTQAYSKGCYGCVHSVKQDRHWKCQIENQMNIDLNYPNAARSECRYSVAKKRG